MVRMTTGVLLALFLAISFGSCGKSDEKAAEEVKPAKATTQQMDSVVVPAKKAVDKTAESVETAVEQTVDKTGTMADQAIDTAKETGKEGMDALTEKAREAVPEEYKGMTDAAVDMGKSALGVPTESMAKEEAAKKKSAEALVKEKAGDMPSLPSF